MNKIVKCEYCKKMYYCETTYLGGCTYGELWEEKKQHLVHTIDESKTKRELEKPITDLSKLIGQKWFKSLDELAEKVGVPVNIIKNVVNGKKVRSWNERRIRDFLEKL